MNFVSRRDALNLAAAGVASVSGLAANARVGAEQPQEKQGKIEQANRSVGPDPHAEPNPIERHAIVKVRRQFISLRSRSRTRPSTLLCSWIPKKESSSPIRSKRRPPDGCEAS